MSKRVVVAIDGPAGAGKSTVARGLAARLGYVYIDTGAMYRAIALWAKQLGIGLDEVHKLERLAQEASIAFSPGSSRTLLNSEDVSDAIREPGMDLAASKVSTIPGVRRALVDKQREMAAETSVIMEGRDIGTVVFPDAEVKIYLDANPDVRAGRRIGDLQQRGQTPAPEDVAKEIAERDQRDRTRAEAPLIQAPDAVYVDTTGLDAAQVEEELLRIVRSRVSNGKEVAR